ncbi:MAG: hypothetical protein ABJL67_24930 [Sulfitobacter sp.]
MTEKLRSRNADGSLYRGQVEVVLSQSQEQFLHVGDVEGEMDVEDDGVVDVGGNAVQALDDLVDDFDDLPWSSAASLTHNQHLEKARECTESSERDRVLAHRYLMDQEARSKSEKIRPVSSLSRTSSTRGSW